MAKRGSFVGTSLKCRGDLVDGVDTSLDLAKPVRPVIPATIAPVPVSSMSMEITKMIFDRLKKGHKFAKVMKSDDTEVPVLLWAVCRKELSVDEKRAFSVLRVFCLLLATVPTEIVEKKLAISGSNVWKDPPFIGNLQEVA